MTSASDGPPFAPQEDHVRRVHGREDNDVWQWMRDVDDPRLAALLGAENAYAESITAADEPLRESIFTEIRGRIRETDLSVPWRRGEWWYQSRTFEGKSYPVHVRMKAQAGETDTAVPDEATALVVLDENLVAEGHDYSQVVGALVSPDATLLAWAVDHRGDELAALRIRDLATGTDREEVIESISSSLAWAADSRHVFYVTVDDTLRPDTVWCHELDTDRSDDFEVFHEPDERFFVSVDANRSDDWIIITTQSAVTGTAWLLDAHDVTAPLIEVAPRRQGVEVRVEAHRNEIFIMSNADDAEDFALFRARVDAEDGLSSWREMIPHRQGTRLDGVDVFADFLVVHFRENATTRAQIIELASGETRDLHLPDSIGTLSAGANAEFEATKYRFVYESLATPPTLFEEDVVNHTRVVLKQQEVLGGYDPSTMHSERSWAAAPDGTAIPLSIVRRHDTPTDGTAPCLLYGYGAYEISVDPWFSAARLSLLDRGWIFAIAHVRGGGEMGRHWYLDGKFGHKMNSFTDFVACARHLIDAGATAPDRLAIRGGSAGGLLIGAALNLAPELFAAAVAEVPFVDPLNTLLDPSLPLTVTEWEEWGNPLEDPEAFDAIAAYSPYENVRPLPYPAVLATAGVNDPRVSVHEPAKWVQRLRATTTGSKPIVMRTEMGAGHGGPTGRYDAWRDEAFVLAFILDQVAR